MGDNNTTQLNKRHGFASKVAKVDNERGHARVSESDYLVKSKRAQLPCSSKHLISQKLPTSCWLLILRNEDVNAAAAEIASSWHCMFIVI